ncbi:MAG: exo-alpha-sialidase [Acidobacteria bacterium]|nr:exo-alpha-sialidase [Acidobacteriota bacterium]
MIIAKTCAALLIAGAAGLAAACSPASDPNPAAESRQWSVDIRPVASPAGSGSSAPQLTASDRGIILSWFEPAGDGTALKFAEWTGSGWSATRTAAAGDNWFVSYADVPSVIRMADGTLVANWLEATRAEIEAYDLWLSYSTDEGRTWASVSFLRCQRFARQVVDRSAVGDTALYMRNNTPPPHALASVK